MSEESQVAEVTSPPPATGEPAAEPKPELTEEQANEAALKKLEDDLWPEEKPAEGDHQTDEKEPETPETTGEQGDLQRPPEEPASDKLARILEADRKNREGHVQLRQQQQAFKAQQDELAAQKQQVQDLMGLPADKLIALADKAPEEGDIPPHVAALQKQVADLTTMIKEQNTQQQASTQRAAAIAEVDSFTKGKEEFELVQKFSAPGSLAVIGESQGAMDIIFDAATMEAQQTGLLPDMGDITRRVNTVIAEKMQSTLSVLQNTKQFGTMFVQGEQQATKENPVKTPPTAANTITNNMRGETAPRSTRPQTEEEFEAQVQQLQNQLWTDDKD